MGSRREKGLDEEKGRLSERGAGERGKPERGRSKEDGRQEESETEIEKENDAPSPPRLEVENFLIENYESYLLCRGFGGRVARPRGKERRGEERGGEVEATRGYARG